MKILYTAVETPVPGTHGGSVHALELCRTLAGRGHHVHLVAPPPGSGHSALDDRGIETDAEGNGSLALHRLRRPPRFLEWTATGIVRRLARRLQPDVIVERFYTFAGGGIAAAHRLGLPAVLEVNSPARPYPGSWRDRLDRWTLVRPVDRWRRRQLSWSDGIYTTSMHLLPDGSRPRARVVVNGVDVDRFRPGVELPEHGPLLCAYVSSFRSWHGAEDLVQAVKSCVEHGIEVRVACIGQGPRWQAARELAVRFGVDDVMEFVGRLPHARVPEQLAAAHVGLAPFSPLAFSALQLGWFWSPIKIFEYLAAGLPVVTADLDELRALLPGEVARFYPAGDASALAEALIGLAADRHALRRMRVNARALAEDRYTWERQAAIVEKVLLEAIARHGATSP